MSNTLSTSNDWFQSFSRIHGLPESYADSAERYFLPLALNIAELCHGSRPLLVGINGCQGSGKSTLAHLLAAALEQLQVSAMALSLDDFYLTRADRQALAKSKHPLFATRGVPGTHDVTLMKTTFDALLTTREDDGRTILVPVFNKAMDDRTEMTQWRWVSSPVDVVIWEGWCLGVSPQPIAELVTPVNTLEATEDPGGFWRSFANEALANYQPLFDRVDHWVMLKAPDFNCVYQWRLEQEEKLGPPSDAGVAIMDPQQVRRFIQFYQRLTEWGFASLPPRTDSLFTLDAQRGIQSFSSPRREVRL